MKKLVVLAFIGVAVLALAYRFRHPILHFHPHFRFRKLGAIAIVPNAPSMPKGSRKKLIVIAQYRDGSKSELVSGVVWTSSDSSVASTDAEGIVTAASEGNAVLRASAESVSATATVSVVPVAPVALAITSKASLVRLNEAIPLKVMAISSDDSVADVTNQVTWKSSNPSSVSVSPNGRAVGASLGSSVVVADMSTPLGEIQTSIRLEVVSSAASLNGEYSYRYDDTGTGQNRFESTLTPQNVIQDRFGKLFSMPVDGRVYAQPLYVHGVSVSGKGLHNVVYAATEHNTVFAFDADSGTELFHTSLGPAFPISERSCPGMGPEIGVTSTPVIDPVTSTLYVADKSSLNGKPVFYLHALDVRSGEERSGSPVLITASVPGSGTGSHHGEVVFNPEPQLQRPGLVISNGRVIVAFGSMCDAGPFHGWVFAYNAVNLKLGSVFLTTPNGSHGGVWQAGAPLVESPMGDLYTISGDGEFDAYDYGGDYGDAFLRLQFDANGGLSVKDYFVPFDQHEMDVENLDLGSSGPMTLPDQVSQHPHLMFGAGKNGSIYLVDRDQMGHYQSLSNDQIVQCLQHIYSARIHASPGYWSNANSEWVYIGPVGGQLQAFQLSRGRLSPIPSSQTSTIFQYPGTTPVISSNGDANGILWALENRTGVLHAYDATNLATELYNSRQAPNRRDAAEQGVQFFAPVVANGKVYFGTQTHVYAYGLLSKP
jgi:outer membrane protein assembly factor BamB